MKFEDLLTQSGENKLQLQEHVELLEEELDWELQVKRVLQCAMMGPIGCCQTCSCPWPLLPVKVQMLLVELSLLEEEIGWMEIKVNELKLNIYQEKKRTKKWELSAQL